MERNIEIPGETRDDPHQLAKRFKGQIKSIIATKYDIMPDGLSLLLSDQQGAYFSQEELNTFCCFVVGENGFLYLVTAEVKNDKTLDNFKSDIVS